MSDFEDLIEKKKECETSHLNFNRIHVDMIIFGGTELNKLDY